MKIVLAKICSGIMIHCCRMAFLAVCFYSCYTFGEDSSSVVSYRKAAEHGDADAQKNIGNCYLNGTGVAKDAAEAVKWYRKAAEQQYAKAQNNLGNCYANGDGVTKDTVEAVKWYRIAAEQGDVDAQRNIGNCYLNGTGVAKDEAEAAIWFNKAIVKTLQSIIIAIDTDKIDDLQINIDTLAALANADKSSATVFSGIDQIVVELENKHEGLKLTRVLCFLTNSQLYKNEPRRMRKILDKLAAIFKNNSDTEQKISIAKSLAMNENRLNNLADSIGFCNDGINLCNRSNDNTAKIFFYRILLDCYYKLNEYDKVLSEADIALKSAKEKDDIAFVHITKAIAYANKQDWAKFNHSIKIANQLNEYLVAEVLSNEIRDIADTKKSNKTEYIVKIAQAVSSASIKKLDSLAVNFISLTISGFGEKAEAKRWEPVNIDVVTQIIAAERLLTGGNSKAIEEGLRLLDLIVPVETQIDNNRLTKDDIYAWILTDKLAFMMVLNDINNGIKIAKTLKSALEKCSEGFLKKMGAAALGNIGSIYVVAGNVGEGIPLLQVALQNIPSDNYLHAVFTLNIGLGYLQAGDAANAIIFNKKSAEEFKKQNNSFNESRALINLALSYFIDENIEDAERTLETALPLIEQTQNLLDLNRYYQIKLMILTENKKLTRQEKEDGIANLSKKIQASTDNMFLLTNFLYLVTDFKNKNNFQTDSILQDIEKYFQYTTIIQEGIELGEIYNTRDKEMKRILFKILSESGDAKKLDYWNKFFEKKAVRSKEVASSENTSEDQREVVSLMQLIAKFENANQIIETERLKQENAQDKKLIQTAAKMKREIESEFETRKAHLSTEKQKKLDSLLADNFVIHPDSLGQLSSVLPEDVACLQFIPMDDAIIVYMVAKNIPPLLQTIKYKDINMSEQQFLKLLVKTRTLLQNPNAQAPLKDCLAQLHQILISPIEPALQKVNAKRIIVNSSGPLRYIPFAALYDGQKYFVEKYQITNVTGLDLIRLSKKRNEQPTRKVNVTVFADPDGTLPAGRKEGQNIAGLFNNNKIFVGDKATLDEFESMIGNVNFIHLATHAVLDPDKPQNSFIQFADGKKWRYADMMGFNVENVDSIALSACSTAVSEKSNGGEIEGMAYQLLRKSPSGSVLASFWKVDDSATAMLMCIYYKHIVDSIKSKNTLDRGGALREAQLTLLKNPDTSSPYYWAAFTLFGDFR